MYDTGGAGDSLRTMGMLGGAALGGAAGLASSIAGRAADRGSFSEKLTNLLGKKQQGVLGQDLGAGALGAVIGGVGGRALGSLAEHAALAKNKRYAEAERMTGIPRSKLEELPLATRIHLLGAAGHKKVGGLGGAVPDAEAMMALMAISGATRTLEKWRKGGKAAPKAEAKEEKPEPKEKTSAEKRKQTDRQRIQKILGHRQSPGLRALAGVGIGGAVGAGYGALRLQDDPAIGAAIGGTGFAALGGIGAYLGARHHNRLVDMPKEEKQKLIDAAVTLNAISAKHATDYSAAQLREYQLKHLEPGMGSAIDALGTTAGGLLGYAGGSALGDSPVYRYGGAAAGTLGGMLAARAAKRMASQKIKDRYLTRRVLEQAGGTPVSAQLQAMRTSPAPTLQTEQLVTKIPPGQALKITTQPHVEGLP